MKMGEKVRLGEKVFLYLEIDHLRYFSSYKLKQKRSHLSEIDVIAITKFELAVN